MMTRSPDTISTPALSRQVKEYKMSCCVSTTVRSNRAEHVRVMFSTPPARRKIVDVMSRDKVGAETVWRKCRWWMAIACIIGTTAHQTNLLFAVNSSSLVTSIILSRAGDIRFPTHLYTSPPSPWEARKGSKVKVATATVSFLDVVMEISLSAERSITDTSVTLHIAVGMLVRPVIFSNTIQFILNSDPATSGPEAATLARRGYGGTTWSHYIYL